MAITKVLSATTGRQDNHTTPHYGGRQMEERKPFEQRKQEREKKEYVKPENMIVRSAIAAKLNIRTLPSRTAPSVYLLSAGEKVKVISDGGEWTEVELLSDKRIIGFTLSAWLADTNE